jgi:hypothetical protein
MAKDVQVSTGPNTLTVSGSGGTSGEAIDILIIDSNGNVVVSETDTLGDSGSGSKQFTLDPGKYNVHVHTAGPSPDGKDYDFNDREVPGR